MVDLTQFLLKKKKNTSLSHYCHHCLNYLCGYWFTSPIKLHMWNYFDLSQLLGLVGVKVNHLARMNESHSSSSQLLPWIFLIKCTNLSHLLRTADFSLFVFNPSTQSNKLKVELLSKNSPKFHMYVYYFYMHYLILKV